MSLYNICLLILTFVFSLILSIQDIKERLVSNWLLLVAGVLLLGCQLWFNIRLHWLFLLSGIAAGVFYLIVRILSKNRFGIGDVYFGIIQGIVVPIEYFWLCICIQVVAAFIYWLVFRKKKTFRIPFIPFMSLGMLCVVGIGVLL